MACGELPREVVDAHRPAPARRIREPDSEDENSQAVSMPSLPTIRPCASKNTRRGSARASASCARRTTTSCPSAARRRRSSSAGYDVELIHMRGADGKGREVVNGVSVSTLPGKLGKSSKLRYMFDYASFFVLDRRNAHGAAHPPPVRGDPGEHDARLPRVRHRAPEALRQRRRRVHARAEPRARGEHLRARSSQQDARAGRAVGPPLRRPRDRRHRPAQGALRRARSEAGADHGRPQRRRSRVGARRLEAAGRGETRRRPCSRSSATARSRIATDRTRSSRRRGSSSRSCPTCASSSSAAGRPPTHIVQQIARRGRGGHRLLRGLGQRRAAPGAAPLGGRRHRGAEGDAVLAPRLHEQDGRLLDLRPAR